MKLIFHPVSPFNRMSYIVAPERGCADQISLHQVVVAPVKYEGWSTDNDLVGRHFADKTLLAVVNGILDSEVLVIYEEKLRDEKGIRYDEWIEGMREKEVCGFDFLNAAVQRGDLRLRQHAESVSAA